MDIIKCLEELCATPGVGGMEDAALAAAAMLRDYTEEVTVDPLGNVLGILRCGKANAPLVLLEAHIDEIGFIVTHVDDGGFVHVAPVGGVDSRALAAAEVVLWGEKPLKGVFCSTPPHLSRGEESLPPVPDMGIDVGLDAKKARRLLPPGTRGTFRAHFERLPGGRVCSKALDDRAGVAAVLYCLELLKEKTLSCDVAAAFCVQEELGTRGALTASHTLRPDKAIAVDVSFARTPDADPAKCGIMGKGPMVGWSPCLDYEITRRLEDLAAERAIPFQPEVMGGDTGTDADAIASARAGVPTGLLSIPLRYMHTPVEMIQVSDVEQVGALMAAFVETERAGDAE